MNNLPKLLSMLFFTAISSFASAENEVNIQGIETALKESLPELKPDSIKPTPMKGLFEVMVGPKLFYVSEDGKYLIQGNLLDLKAKEDLTESRLAAARVASLDKMGLDKMISFKPKTVKHQVFVFTDIDCGYCRKLHSEIDQYLNDGIQVNYLFFPRAGQGSESWSKAEAVWCSTNRNEALTKAKTGGKTDAKKCENPVEAHYALGNALGASGTPMIITEKGEVMPGYVPAAELLKVLERKPKGG